jgi:alpha-D-ribose 1-methylphosphonate 5-triphosphate synthase subunit PhnG
MTALRGAPASQNFHATCVDYAHVYPVWCIVNRVELLHPPQPQQRGRWMSVLAKADLGALEAACKALGELPPTQWLRQPEMGLVMVRARIGGGGAKFNLGEVPVTRCAVRLDSGTVGMAWVQGRSAQHAALAAKLDALLQEPRHQRAIQQHVIEPLAALQAQQRDLIARKAAATKVDFYTMAREAPLAAQGN